MISQDEPATASIEATLVKIPLFELKREIGSGANGTVYEATDTLLGRVVAVKVWNGRGRSKAKSEITKIAGLTHPLIVATHMFGLADDHPYAVMEFVPGVSGKERMKSAPTIQLRVEIWRMYSRAQRFMHNKTLYMATHILVISSYSWTIVKL